MNFRKAANRSLFCNGHYDDEYYVPTVALIMAVIYSLLSVATALENILILVALRRDRCLHPPSKLLLCNLTITDLCTALISQPVSAAVILVGRDQIGGELCLLVEYTAFLLTAIFSGLSLSTVTVISVDRLMALLLGIRYRQTITGRRIRVVLFLMWIQSILVGAVSFWNMKAFFFVCGLLVTLKMTISTYCYTRIFHNIWRRRTAVRDLRGEGAAALLVMARYKKTVINSLWVHITLVTCYFPFAVVTTLMLIRGLNFTIFVAQVVAVGLISLNSVLNPIVYCWKIKEVRKAVKETITQFCACFYG